MFRQTLVIGDIHGNFKALQNVLEQSKYDPKLDRLICIGDYVDGYPDSYAVVDLLIQLNKESKFNNIYLLGNHDDWTKEIFNESLTYLTSGQSDYISTKYHYMWNQGGRNTYLSYIRQIDPIPNWEEHKEFFNSLKLYYIENNILFVHAGWDTSIFPDFLPVVQIDKEMVIWDRTLFNRATQIQYLLNKGYNVSTEKSKFGNFDKIFIGHTFTDDKFQQTFPNLQVCNVINIDTGAGHRGKLTAYRLEDCTIFQSDYAYNYYPNHKPR